VTSTIYLDTAAKVARAALTGTALPSVSAKLLSHLKLIIKCFSGADIVTIDSGTMKCVIKPKNAPSGAPSLIDTSAVFSGSGATAQYVFEWDSADSVALRAHIDAAADPTQPVELRCEVEYELDGNAERVAFPIHFETAYTRPEDPAPEANTDTSWEWLKLRAPETNGFSHDDEAKELTVAGGSGSGDVVGPASATDNAIVRYNGTTGKLVQASGITIADGASGTLSGTNTGDQTAESLGLVIGTNVQAYNANLTTFAGIAPAANVQSLLAAADYAAMRTLLGLVIGTNVQAYNANLTTFAGIAPAANVQSLLSAADYAAIRTLLGLVIGTNVQAFNSKLTTLSDGFGAFFLGTGIVRWTGSTYALQLDAIAASDGGTGQTSYTLGDILFAGQTGSITSLTKLAGNTENGVKKFLTQTGAAFGQSAAPQWSSIAPADLGTGSSIDGKYLRGDGTWQSLDLTNATGLPTAGIVDDAVTLAKMAPGTAGNLITYDASGNPAAVATGTAGQVLTSNGAGAAPTMQDASGGGLTNITETLHTASPNNTVNAEQLEVTGGTTNTDLVLTPKGTGALIFGNEPDGTATGGNKRGNYAVDLQATRTFNSRVASGYGSFIGAGGNNMASGQESGTLAGRGNVASGVYSAVLAGESNQVSSNRSIVFGNGCITTGNWGAMAGGNGALAYLSSMWAHSSGVFAATGDAQRIALVARNKTTTNAPVGLFLDGSSALLTISSGKSMHATVKIIGIKSDGTATAVYLRQVAIQNVAGTTSLVGSVNTLGTDTAAGTSISITADDTNDALKIEVTGITSETWRWVATVEGVEVAYGN